MENNIDVKTSKRAAFEENYLFIAESTVIFILLAVKLFNFYTHIKIGSQSAVMCAATLFAVAAIYFIILKFTRLSPMPVLRILYVVLCVLMLIDRVYFNYYGRLPVWVTLGMAWQLGDVSSTIENLTAVKDILYIADIPILFLIIYNFGSHLDEKLISVFTAMPKKLALRFVTVTLTFCVALTAVFTVATPFRLSYLSNELIFYHLADAVKTFSPEKSDSDISDAIAYIPQTQSPFLPEEAEKDLYRGIAEGRNVIIIQVEALQRFAVGLKIDGNPVTPNLDALIAGDSLYFENYFYSVGGGNTSDAEFQVNNSVYPLESESVYIKYPENDYRGLPNILKDNLYSGSYAFHGYKGEYWNREQFYVSQGFDDFLSEENFPAHEVFNLGISDSEFFKYSADMLLSYAEPFYAFMITLSSHHPYVIPPSAQTFSAGKKYEGTLLGNYLQAIHYTDAAIGEFIGHLRESGLYDNSMIVIYGDHYGIGSYQADSYNAMSGLLGHQYYEGDMFGVPLIINIPGAVSGETINKVGAHIDVAPTLLHLLGITDNGAVMFGKSLLDGNDGVMYGQMIMAKGSFITKDIIYCYPSSGIPANTAVFDRALHKIIKCDIGIYENMVKDAKAAFAASETLLRTNSIIRR